MTNIENSFQNTSSFTRSEINALNNLSSNPEQLNNIDKGSLIKLKQALQQEIDNYASRSNNTSAISKFKSQANIVFAKIDSIVSDSGNELDSINISGHMFNMKLSSTPNLDNNDFSYSLNNSIDLPDNLSGVVSKNESGRDNWDTNMDFLSQNQLTALQSKAEHINSTFALKNICKELGISPKNLQKYVYSDDNGNISDISKIDGKIGGDTLLNFRRKFLSNHKPKFDISNSDQTKQSNLSNTKFNSNTNINNLSNTLSLDTSLDGLPELNTEYGRRYKIATEEIGRYEFPEYANETLALFQLLTPEKVFQNNGLSQLNSKAKAELQKDIDKTILAAQSGFVRMAKNLNNMGKSISSDNPVTIYVPNKLRGISLAFTYDPQNKTTPLDIRPFSYGRNGNDQNPDNRFSDKKDSGNTPIGTFEIGQTTIEGKKGFSGKSGKKPGAAMDTIGLEKINNNSGSGQGRGAYTHGIGDSYSYTLMSGGSGNGLHTYRTTGCRGLAKKEAIELQKIYSRAQRAGFAAYEEVVTPVS